MAEAIRQLSDKDMKEGGYTDPTSVATANLKKYPFVTEAWVALKKSQLADAAYFAAKLIAPALGRQLNAEEAVSLGGLDPDGKDLICQSKSHQHEHHFAGLRGFVVNTGPVSTDTDEEGEESENSKKDRIAVEVAQFTPIAGVPESVAKYIRRYADGTPMTWGNLGSYTYWEGEGRNRKEVRQKLVFCGVPFAKDSHIKLGMQAVQNRIRAERSVRGDQRYVRFPHTYTVAGYEAAMRMRDKAAEERRAERKSERDSYDTLLGGGGSREVRGDARTPITKRGTRGR